MSSMVAQGSWRECSQRKNVEAAIFFRAWPGHWQVSFLPYSIGQSSHRPTQIQGEEETDL